MSDVTRLLDAAAAGDSKAAVDLLPLVYGELRKLAAARLAAESPDQRRRTPSTPGRRGVVLKPAANGEMSSPTRAA
jgi:hypothetical protein